MEELKKFMAQYGGIVIGIIVAIVLMSTQLYKLIIGIILVFVCGYAGNYIQHNKIEVKEKLKKFIDKL